MRTQWTRGLVILAVLLLGSEALAHAQADAAAFAVRRHFEVGAGASTFNTDWSGSRMEGVTAWGDFHVLGPNRILRRIVPEVEFRDIPWGGSIAGLSERTIQGGLTADMYQGQRFRFYAKGLIGAGHVNFKTGSLAATPAASSRDDIAYSFGGGAAYRLRPRWSVRADYELQSWPNFAYRKTALTPSGLTVGLGYSF